VLPALQLSNLNEIAASVVDHGDLGCRNVGWRHCELGATRFHAFVIGLEIVSEEHGRGLALLEDGLLVCLGRRVVVERKLQLCAVRVLWRGDREPAIWPLAEVSLLYEAEYIGVEAESLPWSSTKMVVTLIFIDALLLVRFGGIAAFYLSTGPLLPARLTSAKKAPEQMALPHQQSC